MIYNSLPKNFNPKFEIVSCYVECNGKILLLHRHSHKPEGDKWGVPAGKIDDGESLIEAMIREMKEETGYEINSNKLQYLKKLFVKYQEYHFIYHMFQTEVDNEFDVILSNSEHKDYKWISPIEALSLKLVKDLDKCINLSYKNNSNKKDL